tara:strand:- start:3644 stop:3967 length:324 start_codon:yes stop_codon:yes gene_type:complete
METYSKMYKLWKHESFRLHAANMDREYKMYKIDEQIKHLNNIKAKLQSNEPKPFDVKDGNNKSKIKELLNCDDEYAKTILSSYPMHEKNKYSVSKMIYKFVEALLSS